MIDYSELSALAERVKNNDQKAFEQLYMKTCRIVYGIACTILNNKEIAEDITQEVYIKVYLHINQLNDTHSFISWLHMITTNTCQDHLRREKGSMELITEENECDFVDDWLKGEYLTELFDGIIASLPLEQRRVVYLFYYRQMTVGQIAALEDCPIGTVKSRLAYARRTLKKALENEERRSGDKLMLSPVTAALTVMMSLPTVGYTLTADAAVRILTSVLSVVSAAGAAGASGDQGIHIVSDITEEDKPFIFKKWLIKVPLISVIPAITVVIALALVMISASKSNRVSGTYHDLPDSDTSISETQSLTASKPNNLFWQTETVSSDENKSGIVENTNSEVIPSRLFDNSHSSVFLSPFERAIYTSCAAGQDIDILAPRRVTEWIPDGVASDGEYFDIPVSKEWLSSVSYGPDSVFDTAALDFILKMSWDDDWLYVYTEFVDSDGYCCISKSDEELELWFESMLQLSIAESGYDNDYENFIIALNQFGKKRVRIDSFSRYTPQEDDFIVMVTPTSDGDRVVYEVRVPFDSFTNKTIQIGHIYRFAMVIGWGNDGRIRHTQLSEGITGYHTRNPSLFAHLNLVNNPENQKEAEILYNANDLTLLNEIIEKHNLPLTKAPSDYMSIPDDWNGHMVFGGDENRLIMLNLSDMKIAGALDLTGFEHLTYVECKQAGLESIDAHGLLRLKTLLCDENALTELNVTGDIELTTLSCCQNQLTTLDLIGAEYINFLYCSGNKLSELHVEHLLDLRVLHCADNYLEHIDLTKNSNLFELWCECNMLTELDLSSCTNDINLHCEHNFLVESEQFPFQHAFSELSRSDDSVTYGCRCGYRYIDFLPNQKETS